MFYFLGRFLFYRFVSHLVSCLKFDDLHAVSQQNKEWKPKSSQKSSSNSPGVIGTPKKAASSTAENSKDIESNTTELEDKLSQVNIYENQNVIIAQHIRVPETDRCRLTFGTIGTELDSLGHQSKYQLIDAAEKTNAESTARLPFMLLFLTLLLL